jgi:RimJ/RimL family protein N-acetyltransferase/SAM-dependent methyltransferase
MLTPIPAPGGVSLLRPVEPSDVRLIFEFRNDPWIVSLSTNRREITWEEHTAWFAQVLDESRHLLFIIQAEGDPAGAVRLDRIDDATARISVYLLRPFTGRGLGPQAVKAACASAFRRWPWLKRVVAHIHLDNEASCKAFSRIGFVPAVPDASSPAGHLTLVLPRAGQRARAAWDDETVRTIRHYSKLVEEHGSGPRAMDWASREGQRLRFAVLAAVGPLRGAEVLDVGCGQGDFLGWLRESGFDGRYHGIDATPAMIEVAHKAYPEGAFEVRNLLKQPPGEAAYDYAFASGVFALRQVEPAEFLREVVSALFRACRKAAAFNSLSSWAPTQEPGEFHADPLETLAYCRTLTPWVALRHDYHARDFTVYLYKDRNCG